MAGASATGIAHDQQGGNSGTKHDGATHAWPKYEAEYLKDRLANPSGRYDSQGLNGAAKSVYLEHVTKNYELEADECLKNEFKQWLQGKHQVNADVEKLRQYEAGKIGRREAFGLLQPDEY